MENEEIKVGDKVKIISTVNSFSYEHALDLYSVYIVSYIDFDEWEDGSPTYILEGSGYEWHYLDLEKVN